MLGDAIEAVCHDEGGPDVMARTIWLDTETTGLAGGTGTYAFLIGLAYLHGDTLITEQFLLRRLSAEGRLLASLKERLRETERLVTFNGQRFDWPILEARFILARQRPAEVETHTDLIHPARWLWHRVLGTHRLSILEEEILGAPRLDDVPGWQIPWIYVQYLRNADRPALDPVIAHNRSDLLAMVGLHGEVVRVLRDPDAAARPLDWEGAGVLLARRGDHRRAAGCFERALEHTGEPGGRWRTLRRLARQYRLLGDEEGRRFRWEREAEAWSRIDRLRAQILEELAKVRERAGNVAGACAAVREAVEVTRALWGGTPGAGDGSDPSGLAARLDRRLARLEKRYG